MPDRTTRIVFLCTEPVRVLFLTLAITALKDYQRNLIMFYLKCISSAVIINIGKTVPSEHWFQGVIS